MSSRRSKRVKNLEEEVETIMLHDESYKDNSKLHKKQQSATETPEKVVEVIGTPTRCGQAVLQDLIQTPRRSCRRSVKPAQDYDDIVKRSLRSCTRSGRKALMSDAENNENNDDVNSHTKWNPAEVGRVSQKRNRKSKRVEKGKNRSDKNSNQVVEDTYVDKNEDSIEENNVLQEAQKAVEILNQDSIENKHKTQSEGQVEDESGKIECVDINPELNKQEINKHSNIDDIEPNFKVLNQTMQLMQTDSEDERESTEKSVPEEICIVFENNISNEHDTQSESSKCVTSAEKNDSFGCYLKSRDINISDLGLNPISHEEDDDENFTNQIKELPKEEEEMPSLIICDDDGEIDSKTTVTLNETFEANKNIKNEEKNEEMEILQLSDDCDTPRKCPRIVLTDTSAQNHILLSNTKKGSAVGATMSSIPKTLSHKLPSTPKQRINGSATQAKLPSTPKMFTPQFLRTPQQTKKQYRVPTPYRSRNFKLDDKTKENIQKTPNKNFPKSVILTTLEPREIVLRGIRKRSLSVCVNEEQRQKLLADPFGKRKQSRMVSFHSPANQTTIIDDLDQIIATSVKKEKYQGKESAKKFVTTRRKRSLSLDEPITADFASRLPRPVLIQNIQSKTNNPTACKPLKRTKLPNFAAIHEKHFNKMENLVDHVSRKQERSKNLINSASKLKAASAQKSISLNKSNTNKTAEKPRALKKIDLNPNSQKVEKPELKKNPALPKKPAFNLSTSLIAKSFSLNLTDQANTSRLHKDNKVESRLQRHMDLFKATRTGSASRRNEVILKGVRSNRRFELQMQHRNLKK